MTALLALATFLAAACSDVVEAYHVRSVTDYRPHRAALLSVAMYAVSCIGWVITVKISLWYMIPEVLGLYAGSWVAVRAQARAAERLKAAQARVRAPRVRVARRSSVTGSGRGASARRPLRSA